MPFGRATTPPDARKSALQLAFEQAMQFDAQALVRRLTDDEIGAVVAAEMHAGDVRLAPSGLPSAAVPELLGRAIDAAQRWRAARSKFDTELEPKRADLEAVQVLEERKLEITNEGKEKQAHATETWAKDKRNAHASAMFDEANARLERKKLEHSNETPTMLAYRAIYAAALLAIGGAEWLINYDVFFIFTGIPAIAAGATLIMAVLLAFAAHAHGEVLKQWSYRFSRSRRDQNLGSARQLALASLALFVVLGAAGGSRYAAVLRILHGQGSGNILGGIASIDVDPLRDVLLSLLANFAAWIVGVFISYYCHDQDPDFMRAQRQFDRARSLRDRRMKPLTDELTSISVRTSEELDRAEQSARTRLAGVKAEHAMLVQIDKHEQAVMRFLVDEARSTAERFRSALFRAVHSIPGAGLTLRNANGQAMPISAYRTTPLDIEPTLSGAE